MPMLLLKAAWLGPIQAPEGWLQPQCFVIWAFSLVAFSLFKFHYLPQKEKAAEKTNSCCRYCMQTDSLSVQTFQFPKIHLRRLQGKKISKQNTVCPEHSVQNWFNPVKPGKSGKAPRRSSEFLHHFPSLFFIYLRCLYHCIWNLACLCSTEAPLAQMEWVRQCVYKTLRSQTRSYVM